MNLSNCKRFIETVEGQWIPLLAITYLDSPAGSYTWIHASGVPERLMVNAPISEIMAAIVEAEELRYGPHDGPLRNVEVESVRNESLAKVNEHLREQMRALTKENKRLRERNEGLLLDIEKARKDRHRYWQEREEAREMLERFGLKNVFEKTEEPEKGDSDDA